MTKRKAPGTHLKPGRKTIYTEEVFEEIVRRLTEGEQLYRICRDDGMPSRATVLRWLGANPALRDRYAQAREIASDVDDDVLLEDIDQDPVGDDNGKVDGAWVQWRRLQIDTKKWIMARRNRRWAEKHQHEHSGGDKPVEINVSMEEVARRVAFLLATGLKAQEK